MVLLTAVIFLIISSACSHTPPKPSSPNPREEIYTSEGRPPASSTFQEESWWKKDENQWFVAFLVVLGIGIAVGASIYIASGANGLTLRIQK